MRFFFSFFAAGFLLCLYFLLTDAPGSGMGWGVGLFGALGLGVGAYNWVENGSPLAEKPTLNDKSGPQ